MSSILGLQMDVHSWCDYAEEFILQQVPDFPKAQYEEYAAVLQEALDELALIRYMLGY